jgi:hypothetical protein
MHGSATLEGINGVVDAQRAGRVVRTPIVFE